VNTVPDAFQLYVGGQATHLGFLLKRWVGNPAFLTSMTWHKHLFDERRGKRTYIHYLLRLYSPKYYKHALIKCASTISKMTPIGPAVFLNIFFSRHFLCR
jgi:hypothetical protein